MFFQEGKESPHEIVGGAAEESSLPVNEDALDAFALQLLNVNLDVAEEKVVGLGVAVAERRQLVEAALFQCVHHGENVLVHVLHVASVVGHFGLRVLQVVEVRPVIFSVFTVQNNTMDIGHL